MCRLNIGLLVEHCYCAGPVAVTTQWDLYRPFDFLGTWTQVGEDALPDGWTLRSGDGTERLTSGWPRKARNPLCGLGISTRNSTHPDPKLIVAVLSPTSDFAKDPMAWIFHKTTDDATSARPCTLSKY